MEILNPTHEAAAAAFAPATRLPALDGATVGVISNGKEGTAGLFDAFAEVLRDTYGVGEVILRTKSNYSAPADDAIMVEARSWDALVAGVGD